MRCNRVRKMLGAYMDEELSGRKTKKIQKHLTMCSACAWELKSLQKIDELGRWMAETEAARLPENYWQNYTAHLHARIDQEGEHPGTGITGLLGRYWRFSANFTDYWARRMAPGLIAALIVIGLITGANHIRHRLFQVAAQGSPETEKISVNLYLKEHENAVMLTSHSAQPSQVGIELGHEDVFYYDAVRGLDREWPGEAGVFLRAPRRSSYPVDRRPSKAPDIFNGHKLSLKEAQESFSFGVVAPRMLYPAYFLEGIRKVEGRECLQLIYTNGISTLSLFEQALESDEKLHSSDFREYVMYSKDGIGSASIIGWNSQKVSFTLIGVEDLSDLMDVIHLIQADYLKADEEEELGFS